MFGWESIIGRSLGRSTEIKQSVKSFGRCVSFFFCFFFRPYNETMKTLLNNVIIYYIQKTKTKQNKIVYIYIF